MIQNQNSRNKLTVADAPPRFPLHTVLGMMLITLGLTVMSGWLLQVRAMVEIRAGFVAMVFNTALLFTLSGLALALPGLLRRPMVHLQSAIGLLLFGWCTLILIENLLDIDLGIDWGWLHIWLHDGNIRPGRLAPNTAVGFMLTGACLLLLNHISTRGREILFQILLFCLLAVGLTGLVGYVLSQDELFGWARSARMAIHTALAMVLLAIALWSKRHHVAIRQSVDFLQADEKISFMSAGILCLVTLVAGLTGFVFQQAVLKDSLRDKLQFRLNGQLSLLQEALQQAATAAEHAGNDNRLLEPAARLLQNPADATALNGFQAAMNGLIHNGFRSATLLAPDGRTVHEAGDNRLGAGVSLSLPAPANQSAAIIWNQELRLQTEMPLLKNGHEFARLRLSQHLEVLQSQLFDLRGLGETGEIALCGARAQQLICLPTGRQSQSYIIARNNIGGQPLPMSYAVNGKTGLIATVDYKGHNVMAAFAPVAPELGLVVKQDTTELYAVIRAQLQFMAPALLLLLLLGTMLMRSQIRPLAQRLSASENQAREQQLEINTVVDSVAEGIMTIDEQSIVESFNAAAAQIFGYRADEVIGQSLTMLMPPDMRAQHEAGMRHYLHSGEARVIGKPKLELPGLRKDGSRFTLELTVNEIRFEARRIFVGVVRDITERKQFEEKLIFLAQYDILTGLPNRALFMDRLSGAILRASRSRSALAVMFLDLDGFKNINDTLGHHTGDALLKKFGERLSMAVRKTDSVARLAGDEFTIILEGLHNPETDTSEVAEKIISAMQNHFVLGEHQVKVTTSIGLAIHADGEADLEELLRRADDAMYRAKQSGKNRWCL